MTVTLCPSCSSDSGVHSIGAFPRAPSVWCGLPYHISSLTLWESAGNCIGGFPSAPSVGCGLHYHIWSLLLWESAGNCFGGFPIAPSVGCGLPYHIWSLLSGTLLATALVVSEVPLGRVWPSLPHLVSTVWNSTGNCFGTPNSTELNNNSTPTQSPTGSLNRMFNRHQAEITVM